MGKLPGALCVAAELCPAGKAEVNDKACVECKMAMEVVVAVAESPELIANVAKYPEATCEAMPSFSSDMAVDCDKLDTMPSVNFTVGYRDSEYEQPIIFTFNPTDYTSENWVPLARRMC